MKLIKYILLILGAIFFTPALMGGPFIKTLHRTLPVGFFFPLIFSLALPFYFPHAPVGAYIFSLFLCVGLLSELEKHGFRFWNAAFIASGATVFFWIFTTQLWLFEMKMTWHQMLLQAATEMITQMKAMATFKEATFVADDFAKQIPGALLSVLVVFVGFSVALERRIHQLFQFPYERRAAQMRPLEFRVPDFVIWIALFSALFSMLETPEPWKMIAQNLVTVCFSLYLFQGLAVTEVFLVFLRAGPILKFFTYFALVAQLILVISAIGFIDFWLDFRKRMLKRIQGFPSKKMK